MINALLIVSQGTELSVLSISTFSLMLFTLTNGTQKHCQKPREEPEPLSIHFCDSGLWPQPVSSIVS